MKNMETPRPPETPEFGYVLPGGPVHRYEPNDGLEVSKRSVGPFDNNVYVLRSAGQVLIVDGANDAPLILQMLDSSDHVVGIVQTHGHPDHVMALKELVDVLACPVFAHEADPMPVDVSSLRDTQSITVGDIEVSVLHTPGHTPGSTCFVAGSFLFSGDTLFPGGPGNTNGSSNRFDLEMTNLETRLFTLPDDTRVCPGHGLDTFIGREREYVPVWRQRGW
ncbi:MAG: MBL fold metallo-hydrolase [Actinomycetota bacterium]